MQRSHQKNAALPGVLSLLGSEVSFPLSLPCLSRLELARSTQSTGTVEQLGQVLSYLYLHPGARAFPHPSVNRSCQERAGLSGVLTQVYRPTGGSSSSQRQQDQLTLEITRWQKASARNLPTETKSIWHHQSHSKSWIPQHTRKARFRFKITSHDPDGGL